MKEKCLPMTTKAIALLALAALAACAPKGGDAPATTVPTAPAPAPAPEPPPAPEPAGDAENGATLYAKTCIACHGADAKGVEHLGKDLTNSEFMRGLTDEELVAFVKSGRGVGDPNNTSGIDMPPKGGNPALGMDDLLDIVAWLRTVEAPAAEEG